MKGQDDRKRPRHGDVAVEVAPTVLGERHRIGADDHGAAWMPVGASSERGEAGVVEVWSAVGAPFDLALERGDDGVGEVDAVQLLT